MKTMNFTASPGLYSIAGDTADMANHISARLAQLEAMLNATYGDSGQGFRDDLTEAVQDNYMWACAMMAGEIRQLFEVMTEGGVI